MTREEKSFDFENLRGHFEPPVLIVSTAAGRGMYSIGEAILQRHGGGPGTHHVPVEELMPPGVVNEDLERYKIICRRFPFLLYLVYTIPLFYYRKYLREALFDTADLQTAKRKIESLNIKTALCVSHRPAFWMSDLKRREALDMSVWGVIAEYGSNLGWKYMFWEQIDGLLSPVGKELLRLPVPSGVKFFKVNLPARREYYDVAKTVGDKNNVLLMCGYWGLGPMLKILRPLSGEIPGLRIHVICGENAKAYGEIRRSLREGSSIQVHGVVPSLIPFLKGCASVITKPGISSLLESHAAGRKIFLLKGLPVAEDNNARYAVENFGAQWFGINAFKEWYYSQ